MEAPTSSTSSSSSSIKSEKELSAALKLSKGQLMKHFQLLLQTAEIPKARSSSLCDGLSTPVHAANLVRDAESVLASITKLKLSLLLGDVKTMNAEVDARRERAERAAQWSRRKMEELSAEVSSALEELEDHYYESQRKSRAWATTWA